MEWAKIQRLSSTVGELAGLLPEDSPCRLAIESGEKYWEEILTIVDVEMAREESWGDLESLYWERLHDLRGPLLGLVETWKALSLPGLALVPVQSQDLLNRVMNLRRRRSFV